MRARSWRAAVLALVALLLGTVATNHVAAHGPASNVPESPLRLSESIEEVVVDLERFVPEYLREEEVPGAAVALIRDGKVVWTEGYGVINAITGEPVTPDALFEVASNSKVVTAYVALRLVDQGVLRPPNTEMRSLCGTCSPTPQVLATPHRIGTCGSCPAGATPIRPSDTCTSRR
jgi:hypothetical protein